MISCEPEKLFTYIPGFEDVSKNVARAIHDSVLERRDAREIADFLHGVWLEHPLHPALTDFVIGAWALGSVLDGISMVHPSRSTDKAADLLISLGNLVAIPTAMSGLADFSTAPRRSMQTGASHGLLNVGGLLLNLLSSSRRRAGKRGAGRCLSATASSLLLLSAWLGGKLVFEQKVGINKIPQLKGGQDWKPVAREGDLQENTPKRVEAEGDPAMICRCGAQTHALGAVCGHEGGPLDEGEVKGNQVTCPWHHSVYDLRNGRVVHGPSTYATSVYETRIQDGNVEIRRI
jgi:nitrite reductase/ring-hydroxylating ferredoxin subunit/uncharacterized membrane protein